MPVKPILYKHIGYQRQGEKLSSHHIWLGVGCSLGGENSGIPTPEFPKVEKKKKKNRSLTVVVVETSNLDWDFLCFASIVMAGMACARRSVLSCSIIEGLCCDLACWGYRGVVGADCAV